MQIRDYSLKRQITGFYVGSNNIQLISDLAKPNGPGNLYSLEVESFKIQQGYNHKGTENFVKMEFCYNCVESGIQCISWIRGNKTNCI